MKVKYNEAAIYCRVAYADETTMETQKDTVMRFAEAQGYTVTESYLDNGKSGVTLDRPGMNRLLADIRGGNIKRVITKDIARIARNIFLFESFLEEARSHGVIILTVHDGVFEPTLKDRLNILQRNESGIAAHSDVGANGG